MKKIKQISLLIFLSVISALSFAQTQIFSQTIKGVVIDADSKKWLPFATVILVESGKTVTADSSGNFKLTDVPIGRHSLLVSLVGYESNTISEIPVTSGKEISLTISLREKIKKVVSKLPMNLPVQVPVLFLLKKQKDMLREPLIRAAWHRILPA